MQATRSASSSSYSSSDYEEDDYIPTNSTAGTIGTAGVMPTTTATTVMQPGVVVVGTHAVSHNVADIDHGAEEPLKGRGSKLRNKLRPHGHKSKRHAKKEGVAATGLATGVGAGLVGGEIVDRSKFTGHGPVDQLDQKLADRNLIDNAASGQRGELYNVGGFPAVESYRQDPDNIIRHKFTGQTHFDHEGPATGPGFTNGDLYDKPGFAGTKQGQPAHNGPLTALAHKIVGQKLTTHEPLMDKIYVEPHQKGPIDALAHMIVGHGGAHPTQTGTMTGYTEDPVVKQGLMSKIKNAIHPKHDDVANYANKEKAEGPVDALVHKLTGTLHDPVHHKGGLGAQHDGVLGGANTVPVTDNIAHTVVTDTAHVGIMGKLKNKLHMHHDATVADKAL